MPTESKSASSSRKVSHTVGDCFMSCVVWFQHLFIQWLLYSCRNHPLPRRPKYTNFVVQGLVTIWTTIGVSIIPAMSTPLDNRQLKHLFHLSGVNVFQYWISVYMWDLATFLISDALILFVLQAYQVELVSFLRVSSHTHGAALL